jgi:putative transposase
MKRHPQHDYTSGAGYHVTIVTAGRRPILGRIINDVFEPSPAGKIVERHWLALPSHFPRIVLDAFALMPDHLHCILILSDAKLLAPERGELAARDLAPLSKIIDGFKTFTAIEINRLLSTSGSPVWQRGYAERIIRNESELEKFRNYVMTNALRKSLPEQ